MSRPIRTLTIALAVALLGAVGYGAWKNPERLELDAAARAAAPGQFVTLSSGTTHYQINGTGTGPVVVLVHGFSVPMYIWDSTYSALAAAGYRVIRYDLYGRGWSDRPDAAFDGPMFDAQLNELLDSLRVNEPVNLVGLSFGGFVTAHYTRTNPRRVRTLTLVDPVSTTRTLPGILSVSGLGPWIFQVTQVPGMADNQASDFLHPEHYPTWADQYRPQMRYRGFGRSLLRSAQTVSRVNFDSLYAAVGGTSVPVLLIWGQQDRTVPIENAAVIRRAIPTVDFFPIDSAGHLPHIEQAALVNAKLQNFFTAPATRAVPAP